MFQFPESEQIVTFCSAYHDFVHTSLAAIPARLGKLVYLARLRDGSGRYQHWGLARTHGELPAQKAMEQAHSEVFLEVLRTPLARLISDYEGFLDSAANGRMEDAGPEADFFAHPGDFVPHDLSGGGAKHFNLIARVLSALESAHSHGQSRAA